MEKVVLVDFYNNKIGLENKITVHRKGLLHRAFSIIIYNKDREILLQKRSLFKYHTPNLWTNTCCSHPYDNESYEEAINRRLDEEMGMECRLDESFSFVYKSELNDSLIEYEHDTVFLGQSNEIPSINNLEVSEYKYSSYDNLKKSIFCESNKYTPWFKIIIDKLDTNFFSFKNFYQHA